MSDTLLGATLGLIAGVAWHAAFLRAWRFGRTLFGQCRAVEGDLPDNQVSMRTVGRALLATVAAGARFGAVGLGLSLPAGRVSVLCRDFRGVGSWPSPPGSLLQGL